MLILISIVTFMIFFLYHAWRVPRRRRSPRATSGARQPSNRSRTRPSSSASRILARPIWTMDQGHRRGCRLRQPAPRSCAARHPASATRLSRSTQSGRPGRPRRGDGLAGSGRGCHLGTFRSRDRSLSALRRGRCLIARPWAWHSRRLVTHLLHRTGLTHRIQLWASIPDNGSG